MSTIWSFAAFDWNSYRELVETLVLDKIPLRNRIAGEDASTGLSDADVSALNAGLAKHCIQKGLDVEGLSTEEMGSLLVYDMCCLGTVLEFEGRFAETISEIRKRTHGYEVAETLTEAMSVRSGTEVWWQADDGICGVLSPQQTSDLAVHLLLLQRETPTRSDSGPLSIFKWRLNATRVVDNLIHDLTDVVTEAAEHVRGLAIMRQE